jgi:hypothetical protein
MLIPYPKKRKREMAAYSKRHYGAYKWRLGSPKLIVIHYAVAGSIRTIYNTFAPDNPDVEFGELPGVCSHYAVGAGGGGVKFVRRRPAAATSSGSTTSRSESNTSGSATRTSWAGRRS